MQDPQLTHHIQLNILRRMLDKPQMRYSELKPRSLEANLFMYHLKQLIRSGLIVKQDQIYVLTREGKRFADRATIDTMKIDIQPKVVILLGLKRADGKWVALRRKLQPFAGYQGLPSGKVRYGETLAEAARRELDEKTGLHGIPLELRGNTIMRFTDTSGPVNHVIAYVFTGTLPLDAEVNLENEYYQSLLVDEADLLREPTYKGHSQIMKKLEDGTFPFIEEYEYQSDF